MSFSSKYPRWTRLVVVLVLVAACGAGTAVAERTSHRSTVSTGKVSASARNVRDVPAVRKAERRARAHLAWRRTARARLARVRSRTAFRDQRRATVARIVRRRFAGFLASNDQVVEPGSVKRYTSDYSAILDGKKLAVSSIPLRIRAASGRREALDLRLESGGRGLKPAAPLAGFELPGRLGNGVELPGGVGLALRSGNPAAAPSRVDDDTALYANAATDTDLLAASLPAGVELSSVLRSPRSPERQSFDLRLPAGAGLKATAGGGAKVVSDDGRTLLNVSPPTATDAQGARVPTSLKVVGDSLQITTSHAGGDWAYPILVDPTYTVWDDYQLASGARGLDGWRGYNNSNYSLSNTCMFGVACYGPTGMYIYSWAKQNYFNGAAGGYEYYIPGWGERRSTYISRVVLSPVFQYRGPREYNLQPFLFVGLWDPAINNWSNSQNLYDTYGYSNAVDLYSGAAAPKRVNVQQYSNANVTLTGHHASYVGAVTIVLDDGETPKLDPLTSSTGAPHWSSSDAGTIALHANDPGLGVQYFATRITTAKGETVDANVPTTEAPGCTGASRAICPIDGHGQLSYDSSKLAEGVNKIEVAARDAAGQGDEQSTKLTNVLVDRSGPDLTVGGGLIDPAVPDHFLTVTARDGDSSTFASARSGVRSIEVLWDGSRADYEQRECDNVQSGVDLGSCELTLSGTVDEATSGVHTLTVVAIDRAGNKTTRDWRVELPDRAPPKLSLSGALAQVSGDWVRPDKYGVTVSADDAGGGVVAEEALVDGRSVDRATQSCPSGGCSLRHDFAVDFSSLAAGEHQVEVTATDASNNVARSRFTVRVDPGTPQIALSGELADRSGSALDDRPYDLNITTNDEAGASGIRTVSVLVDGALARTFTHDCSSGCPAQAADKFTFVPATSPGGGKAVDVVVEDGAGNMNGDGVFAGPPPDLYSSSPAACPSSTTSGTATGAVKAPEAAGNLLEAQPDTLAPTDPGRTDDGDAVDPSLSPDGGGLTAFGNLSGGGQIGLEAEDGFTLGSAICVKPEAVSQNGTTGTIVNGDAVLYADVANSADLAVRPTSLGAASFSQIRSAAAPESYSWDVGLRPGQQLKQVDAHTVAVVDDGTTATQDPTPAPTERLGPDNTADAQVQLAEGAYQIDRAEAATDQPVVAVIRSPWVRDSAGVPVPAQLTVDGNTITLAIVHREPPPGLEYDYPVVAETDFVSNGFARCHISLPGGASLPWPCALPGASAPENVDYSHLCVDPRGILPGFRQFIEAKIGCVRRLKISLSPLNAAGVSAAAAAAFGYCTRKHQQWTVTWQLQAATSITALKWCSERRWLWVAIPGYWPNKWSG